MADDTFTIPEAALYLEVSEPTIYRWMKEGSLSFFKVGRGTRFTQDMLDAVRVTHTGKRDANTRKAQCACCGHGELVPGGLQSTGKLYFRPDNTKFFTLEDSYVATRAFVCTACGFIQLHADPDKMGRLLKE